MVPEGWKLCTISDVGDVITGSTPKTSDKTLYDGPIPFVSPADLGAGQSIKSTAKTLTEKGFSATRKIRKGSTLFTCIGSTIGKIGLAGVDLATNQQINSVVPDSNHDDAFIYFALALRARHIATLAGKQAVPIINKSMFSDQSILTPPLPEQKKIAQILSTWDKAITTTEQLLANSQQQKKALMQQLLTGKKRLLDENDVRFRGEWKFATFNEAFQVTNKKSAQVKSSSYLECGPLPIVDQGKRLVAGYCNNEITFNDVPVIVFGDHTRCVKWVDFEFCPGADGTQVLKAKPLLDIKFAYYLLSNTDIPNLGYSRHMRELKEKDFKVPVEIEEQVAIAKSLTVAEKESCSLAQKMNCLKEEKKALMQQLLTGKRRVKVYEETA